MTRTFRIAATAAVLLFLLQACGQKGPLFRPSEDPAKQSEPEAG